MVSRPIVYRRTSGGRSRFRGVCLPSSSYRWDVPPWVGSRVSPEADFSDMAMAVRLDHLLWRCEALCMALKRPMVSGDNGAAFGSTARIPPWLTQFPLVWEFLSKGSYEDGTPRQLGKVSFCLVSGGVQMTLTDPTSSTYCSRQHPTLEDALLAFELGLSDGSLLWRLSGPPKGKRPPKGLDK